MKLERKLLFLLGIILPVLTPLFSQVTFPARGFAPILDNSQAQKKIDAFKDVFFRPPQKDIYHQAYLYRFQFAHFPSSGQPTIHHGMLSGPYPNSSTLRIDLMSSPEENAPNSTFLLFKDKNNSSVWKLEKEKPEAICLSPSDWLAPWIPGIVHTPFDLLMPFVNWPFEYEKSGRVCGRSAHLFLFSPPNHLKDLTDEKLSIRFAIDDAYDAPLRVEYFDGGILPSRVFSLQSFKKLDDYWVVKAMDAKDRDSRSRTRFELKAYAHGLDLPSSFFEPTGLNRSILLPSIAFQSI